MQLLLQVGKATEELRQSKLCGEGGWVFRRDVETAREKCVKWVSCPWKALEAYRRRALQLLLLLARNKARGPSSPTSCTLRVAHRVLPQGHNPSWGLSGPPIPTVVPPTPAFTDLVSLDRKVHTAIVANNSHGLTSPPWNCPIPL